LVAKSRKYAGVAGSYQSLTNSAPVVSNRSYADTGFENVVVSNDAGDHKTPNAFQLNRTRVTGGMYSGQYVSAPNSGTIVNGLCPSPIYDARTAGAPTFSVPGDLTSKLFAQANPFRPEILLPVFLFELKDLPDMIRQLGRFNIAKKAGNPPKPGDSRLPAQMWLSGNFGWAPLVSDLAKMIGFADSLAKREKEFDQIFSNGGMTRKVTLYETERPASFTYTASIGNLNVSVNGPGTDSIKVWGTVKVKPAPAPSGSPIRKPPPQEVAKALLGLNSASVPANIWEALPWSWLIDYFYNVGSFLQAHAGGRVVTLDSACIMTHTIRSCRSRAVQGPMDKDGHRLSCSSGELMAEQKLRTPVFNPSLPSFRMSPLSGHQLSILGSLAVTRWRP